MRLDVTVASLANTRGRETLGRRASASPTGSPRHPRRRRRRGNLAHNCAAVMGRASRYRRSSADLLPVHDGEVLEQIEACVAAVPDVVAQRQILAVQLPGEAVGARITTFAGSAAVEFGDGCEVGGEPYGRRLAPNRSGLGDVVAVRVFIVGAVDPAFVDPSACERVGSVLDRQRPHADGRHVGAATGGDHVRRQTHPVDAVGDRRDGRGRGR